MASTTEIYRRSTSAPSWESARKSAALPRILALVRDLPPGPFQHLPRARQVGVDLKSVNEERNGAPLLAEFEPNSPSAVQQPYVVRCQVEGEVVPGCRSEEIALSLKRAAQPRVARGRGPGCDAALELMERVREITAPQGRPAQANPPEFVISSHECESIQDCTGKLRRTGVLCLSLDELSHFYQQTHCAYDPKQTRPQSPPRNAR